VLIDDGIAAHDPRVVVSLYTAPMDLEPFSEEAIRAANPAFGDFLNATEVLGMAHDAERMPSRQAEFENLILNRRVEATAPFISRQLWQSCDAAPLPIEEHAVYGGLDLSSANDLTALVLGARVDGIWQIHPAFWLPAAGLAAKARLDRVPYDVWHRDGYLLTAPGKSVDYEYVAEYLRGVFDRYDVRKIGFDRWGWRHLRPWLLKAGFTDAQLDEHFHEYGQGFQDMSPALRALEAEILNGRIAHGGHPVLSMNMANAVVKSDPAGNRKLAKDRSAGRIDGAVALAMLCGVAPLEDSQEIDIRAMIV
jgi:phage terminase large subunit-like protein